MWAGRHSDFSLSITRLCDFLKHSRLQTRGGRARALSKAVPTGIHPTLSMHHFLYFLSVFPPPLLRVSGQSLYFYLLSSQVVIHPTSWMYLWYLKYYGKSKKYVIQTISRSLTKRVPWVRKNECQEYKILELLRIIKQMYYKGWQS